MNFYSDSNGTYSSQNVGRVSPGDEYTGLDLALMAGRPRPTSMMKPLKEPLNKSVPFYSDSKYCGKNMVDRWDFMLNNQVAGQPQKMETKGVRYAWERTTHEETEGRISPTLYNNRD